MEEAAVDVSFPMCAVVPSAHGPVLAVLARASEPLTGHAVAELAQPTAGGHGVHLSIFGSRGPHL